MRRQHHILNNITIYVLGLAAILSVTPLSTSQAACPEPLTISDATELTDCIIWANGNTGADTLELDADITLTAADTSNSTEYSGTYAGLPDVTSEIIIQAGTGTIIERSSTICDSNDANQFRIFNVTGGA